MRRELEKPLAWLYLVWGRWFPSGDPLFLCGPASFLPQAMKCTG